VKRETKILGIFATLIVLSSLVSAAGYTKLCMSDGESIPPGGNTLYTCNHDRCEICVNENYFPTLPSRCNDFPGCSFLNQEGTLDRTPPTITINYPLDESVYTSRKILLDIDLDEKAKLERYDPSRRRWYNLCKSCGGYSRSLSFKEGEQDLLIRATDRRGSSSEKLVTFFVDSKKPRVSRTEPRRGFASGIFTVQITEDNPEKLTLYYGNGQTELNIDEDCYIERKRQYCKTNVDISPYNGQEIEYWFELEDLAGNVAKSKSVELDVDSTFPSYEVSYEIDRRYVYFTIEVDEENFDEIYYTYDDRRGRERKVKLCSRLKNNECSVRKSFREGDYNIMLQVVDEAGNMVGENIDFTIDY
tara:strand:- start:7569 stop:8648 length:1080 start_codon:yes stop_codon:yes gene_type:complete